ncbi:hypothetical protein Tco_0405141, partial [Tanacetum coccineum]
SPVGSTFLILGSLTLLPSLPTRLPVPPPSDAAVGRPALRVITLGGIIHTRENMGNVRELVEFVGAGLLGCISRYWFFYKESSWIKTLLFSVVMFWFRSNFSKKWVYDNQRKLMRTIMFSTERVIYVVSTTTGTLTSDDMVESIKKISENVAQLSGVSKGVWHFNQMLFKDLTDGYGIFNGVGLDNF